MSKFFLFWFFSIFLLLPFSARSDEPSPRGLFVSIIQDPQVLSSRKAILQLIHFSKKARIQLLFIQIYFANKAWFPSKVGDPTAYESCLREVGEDPIRLLIREAHASGIQVHAWLNMLSLNNNEQAPLLQKYGTQILTRDRQEKKSLSDYKIDNQYFLEPGDPRVRDELKKMIEEVLSQYPELDGIQFDYLRYPDTHPVYGYTAMNVERFKKEMPEGKIEDQNPVWKDWKRRQVTDLLELLAQRAREIRSEIKISATGCMPYPRAYEEAFQDWPSWINRGIVDFVTVMDYSPIPKQFERWILNVVPQVHDIKKMNIGIGVYKLLELEETFAQEVEFCENSDVGACVFFHYGSFLESPGLIEPLVNSPQKKGSGGYREET